MRIVISGLVLLHVGLCSVEADTPGGLSELDWSSIRSVYEDGRHQFHRREDGSHVATNTGQGWTMEFDGRGFTASPEGGAWTWGLELDVADIGTATAVGNRLTVGRGENLEEWFVNDARGLEQGWTIKKRPIDASESLRLSLRVRGEMTAAVTGSCVTFGDGTVTYGGLKAWDATGRLLPARFVGGGKKVHIEVEDAGAEYPIIVDPVARQAYLKASNTGDGDGFGSSVAVSGDTVVVGAWREDSSARGTNGNQTLNDAYESGAAYVFVRKNGVWSQEAYLKASNTDSADFFGSAVAISGDTIVVGASEEASASTVVNGNQADNSAMSAGAAYVYERIGSVWRQRAYLKASNAKPSAEFGYAVTISGGTIAIAARGSGIDDFPGGVYVFQWVAGEWSQQASFELPNPESVAISGYTVVAGSTEANFGKGEAYVIVRDSSGGWTNQAVLRASNADPGDSFGRTVGISGDTIIVGAPTEDSAVRESDNNANSAGAAYVFKRDMEQWSQEAYLKSSSIAENERFGESVAISGDLAVAGVYTGAAYVFERRAGRWRVQSALSESTVSRLEFFGYTVAISGRTVVVGAFREDSNSVGVNGDSENENAESSGAVFIYNAMPPQTQITLLKAPTQFETTRVGQRSRTLALVLRNNGQDTLAPLQLTLKGRARRDFQILGPSSRVVRPGALARAMVVFKPTRPGKRNAMIAISGNIRTRNLMISGTGRQAGPRAPISLR